MMDEAMQQQMTRLQEFQHSMMVENANQQRFVQESVMAATTSQQEQMQKFNQDAMITMQAQFQQQLNQATSAMAQLANAVAPLINMQATTEQSHAALQSPGAPRDKNVSEWEIAENEIPEDP